MAASLKVTTTRCRTIVRGMPTSKRRQPRGHRKGPTPRKRLVTTDRLSPLSPAGEETDSTARGPGVPASSRYTPPKKNRGVLRPGWHKVVGVAMIVLGVAVFVLNDIAWVTEVILLPGAHNELYAMVAFAVAGSSLWWFGWLDRTPERW